MALFAGYLDSCQCKGSHVNAIVDADGTVRPQHGSTWEAAPITAVTFHDHAELRDHALRMSDALGAARDHPGFSAEAITAIDTARRADAWRRTAGLLPPKGTP